MIAITLKKKIRFNNNNNNLFEKQQNEWLVPQKVTKTNRGGRRRIQEHFRKVTRTYKYRHAKTLRSNRFRAYILAMNDKQRLFDGTK